MKPFDLEKALAGDPVITGDGRKVEELYYFKKLKNIFPIAAVIDGNLYTYQTNGRSRHFDDKDADIFMETKKLYIAIEKKAENPCGSHHTSNAYTDKSEAEKFGSLYATLEVEIEV
jgi:hypothetical protein